MVDKDSMSVDEVLAYCRQHDGEGGDAAPSSSPEPSADESSQQESAPKVEASPAKPAKPAKPPGEMSVEEMLAAARGEKSGAAAETADAEAEEPVEAAPAAGGEVDPKAAREMSVEEMLAAARGGGAAQAKAKPKAKAKSQAKSQAKPKAKPAAKAGKAQSKEAQSKEAGPRDTGSIFGQRNPNKPGPVSKSEAAAATKVKKEKPEKPEKAMPVMPERPRYAVPSESAASVQGEGADRRGFFAAFTGTVLGSSMAIGFASLAVTNLLWGLGLAKFMFPNILIEPPTNFKVGFPGEYAPGQVQTKFKAQFGVWIVRYEYEGDSQIYALKSVCTHLGCTPNWLEGEQKFKCPCHGSGFYKDGINFEGPAPRPLERYAIRLSDDGQLEVDKSRTFNEEKGQWSDSASYVTV